MSGSVSAKLSQIRRSAKRRGKEFNLTNRYVANLCAQSHCAYTGIKFTQTNRSFERLDNTKGYVMGNVIPVLKSINLSRGDSELSDIILALCDAELRQQVNPALTMIDHAYYNFKRAQKDYINSIANIDKKIAKHSQNAERLFKAPVHSFFGATEDEKYSDKAFRYCNALLNRRNNIEKREKSIQGLKQEFKNSVRIQKCKAIQKMSRKTCNKLIDGMIRYTNLNACQRYNLAQGRVVNYGLAKNVYGL